MLRQTSNFLLFLLLLFLLVIFFLSYKTSNVVITIYSVLGTITLSEHHSHSRLACNVSLIVTNAAWKLSLSIKRNIKCISFFSHRHFSFWIGLRLNTRIIARQWKGKIAKEFDTRLVWSRLRFGIGFAEVNVLSTFNIGDRGDRCYALCACDMRHEAWFFRFCCAVLSVSNRTKRILKSY